jgi:hypothetical protein
MDTVIDWVFFDEIASHFGNPVGERNGAVHLWSHRYSQGRFVEISSDRRVESRTGRDGTLIRRSCRVEAWGCHSSEPSAGATMPTRQLWPIIVTLAETPSTPG